MKPNKSLFILLAVVCFYNSFARSNNNGAPSFAFIENKGQIADQYYHSRNDIQFKLAAGGMNIFIGNGQIHYQWAKSIDSANTDLYRLDMTLEGANTRASVITEQQQPGYEQYYLTQCPNGVKSYSFKKITYKNVYPNIDWVLYTNDNQLKYDFIVHPGGDAADIRLKYDGATSLSINNGAVTATTPFGSITEEAPYSYNAETKSTINSKFILNKNSLSFDVAPYSGTLVIDPGITVNWFTFFGGPGIGTDGVEYGTGVTTDIMGNVTMVGRTSSASNIATTGAFQTTWFTGYTDAFAAKFNAAGALQWATYYGNTLNDYFTDITCDISGNLFCCGVTYSPAGMATPGAYRTYYCNISDVFLVKFDASGARQWATYYGGGSIEEPTSVVCDLIGNVYMAGNTASDTGIASPGAHQTVTTAPPYTGFIVKFTSTGTRQWATYYGGFGVTNINDMACTISGDIIIAGKTRSDTGIATAGGFVPTYHTVPGCSSLCTDGFVAKFNSAGVRQWGTYYGGYGNGEDGFYAVSVDTAGNIYATGSTVSTTDIATPGAAQTTPSIGMFIKFDASGSRLWGTYCGIGIDIVSDISANQYIVSTAGSSSFGIIKWNKDGISTGVSINGSTKDGINFRKVSLAYNPMSGNLYAAGSLDSAHTGSIATAGAYQTKCQGQADAWLQSLKVDSGLAVHNIYQHNTDVQLFPNPNTGSFTLKADFSKTQSSGNVTIEVVNLMGVVVYKEIEKTTISQLNKQLKLDVPAGIYLLRVTNGETMNTMKFSVQK